MDETNVYIVLTDDKPTVLPFPASGTEIQVLKKHNIKFYECKVTSRIIYDGTVSRRVTGKIIANPNKRFVHDCSSCVFLGTSRGDSLSLFDHYDLYYHKSYFEETVIARWGSHGPEYISGLNIAHAAIQDAVRLAKEKGLLK